MRQFDHPCRGCKGPLDATTIGERKRADGMSEVYCRACGIGDPVGVVWERYPMSIAGHRAGGRR